MRLGLLFAIILFTSGFVNVRAQNYPYLNASTGNEGTFIIDVDSNIYMFHNSQIEKVDKNFNPIWVKTYNGISFYSLLLSKNGNIYFIASDTINYASMPALNTRYLGKIDATGNLVWCKTADNSSLNLSINFNKLLLDRNHDLIASCNLGMIKLDTLGNMYYFKHIQSNMGLIADLSKTTILRDSLGYYFYAFSWQAFQSSGIGQFKYNETLDTFSLQSYYMDYPKFWGVNDSWFYQSKYDETIYYSITVHSMNGPSPGARFYSIRKHRNGIVIWNKKFGCCTYPYIITSFEEDRYKNILFNTSPLSMGYHVYYTNDNIKLDSNGIFNGTKSMLLNYSWLPATAQFESTKLQSLYSGKYFYTIVGKDFPSNPLSITILDSTLFSNCATTSSITITNNAGVISSDTLLSKKSITPYLLQNKTINVTPILNFTIGSNYCNVLNLTEKSSKKVELYIYPNPSNNIINIVSTNNVEEISIYDINSKKVLVKIMSDIIDVSSLHSGLYFIKIKTDQGEFSRKFIKE